MLTYALEKKRKQQPVYPAVRLHPPGHSVRRPAAPAEAALQAGSGPASGGQRHHGEDAYEQLAAEGYIYTVEKRGIMSAP